MNYTNNLLDSLYAQQQSEILFASTFQQAFQNVLDSVSSFQEFQRSQCFEQEPFKTQFESCLFESKILYPDYVTISNELAEELKSIVQTTQSHIAPEQCSDYTENILPELNKPGNKHLSFDRIVCLIELLLALLTFIVTIMPDSQKDELIAQNNQLIAIEQERLELERQRTENLENISHALVDVINSLCDQVESQTEHLDDLGELIQHTDRLESPNCQYDNSGSLNENTRPDD